MAEDDFNIAVTAAAASTDLLHRRIAMPYSFQLRVGDSAVRVKTDFAPMSKALLSLKTTTDPAGEEANAQWEIAVETHGETEVADLPEAETGLFEVHHFGPSCAIRMESGSWFAHTPSSLNGVGFALVNGTERDQVRQLSVYLRTIAHFLDNAGARSIPDAVLEVSA